MVLIKIMKTHVERCLTAEGENTEKQFLAVLKTLRSQLNDRFRDIESQALVTEGSFLDPRFKRHTFINKDKYEYCLRSIKGKLRTLVTREGATLPEPTTAMNQSQQPSSSMWADYEKEVENEIIRNPTAASIVEWINISTSRL